MWWFFFALGIQKLIVKNTYLWIWCMSRPHPWSGVVSFSVPLVFICLAIRPSHRTDFFERLGIRVAKWRSPPPRGMTGAAIRRGERRGMDARGNGWILKGRSFVFIKKWRFGWNETLSQIFRFQRFLYGLQRNASSSVCFFLHGECRYLIVEAHLQTKVWVCGIWLPYRGFHLSLKKIDYPSIFRCTHRPQTRGRAQGWGSGGRPGGGNGDHWRRWLVSPSPATLTWHSSSRPRDSLSARHFPCCHYAGQFLAPVVQLCVNFCLNHFTGSTWISPLDNCFYCNWLVLHVFKCVHVVKFM